MLTLTQLRTPNEDWNSKHISYTKEIKAQISELQNNLESLQKTNGISPIYSNATANLDLTSDHTKINETLSISVILRKY
jgi:hypothetical protein